MFKAYTIPQEEIQQSHVFNTAQGQIIFTPSDVRKIAEEELGLDIVREAIDNPMPGSNPFADMLSIVEGKVNGSYEGTLQSARWGKLADDRSEQIRDEYQRPGSTRPDFNSTIDYASNEIGYSE